MQQQQDDGPRGPQSGVWMWVVLAGVVAPLPVLLILQPGVLWWVGWLVIAGLFACYGVARRG